MARTPEQESALDEFTGLIVRSCKVPLETIDEGIVITERILASLRRCRDAGLMQKDLEEASDGD